ncbi:MAG TPA: tryptophan dimethylallyltransferase family protein [Polyangiaceae bacterium]|jgi:DMATS type aromatic prenyltransferase
MTTYRQLSSPQLFDLCHALGLGNTARQCLAAQAFLTDSWSEREVPSLAPYPSRIGDDHSPYEYSVQFARGSAEVRLLFEAQASVPSLLTNQLAARSLNERIVRQYGVDLAPFYRVEDLFCPADPQGPFSLWHAVCFDEAGRPDFKMYLNPNVIAGVSGQDVITEAVSRLDLEQVAKPIIEQLVARGAVPNYFSLDLGARLGSRVKLYFSHERATLEDLERIFALAPTNQAGDISRFCKAILGRAMSLGRKPVCYCFSFAAGADAPVAVTFHLPVAHYMDSDASIMKQVSAFMASEGLPVHAYQRAVKALARRDLANNVGLQSYVSFRREASGLKLTVYLSPELFAAPYAQFPFSEEAVLSSQSRG